MNLFYAPKLSGQYFTLNHEESKHIVRVLRKQTGDLVHLTDGRGFFYECRIRSIDQRECELELVKKTEGTDKRDFLLHLAVAPTKNINRFEWFLEKVTEIGIDRITPIITGHSERTIVKKERLERVIVSAMKQSLKSHVPVLDETTKLSEFLKLPFDGEKYIAYIDEEVTDELSKIYIPKTNALVLIGPEGDFSLSEVELARSNGFKAVRLGPSRLRTETAAVTACHTINLLNY